MKSLKKMAFALTVTLTGWSVYALDLPGSVVSAQWLAQNQSQVQIVDVRSDKESLTRQPELSVDKKSGKKIVVDVGGHIAGARLVNMGAMRVTRKINGQDVQFMIPEKAEFEKMVQSAGIDSGKPIVLVPMGTATEDVDEALRVYWQFKVYGENNIAVLNGGTAGWLLEGNPVTQDTVAQKTGNWHAGKEQMEYLASSEDVAAAADKGAQVVDSRNAAQYYGLGKRDYVYSYGHVAGAKLVSPDVLTKNVQGVAYFYSPATYASLFSAAGVNPQKPAITYCNSGHLASGTWFVMSEIVGNKQTRLYNGSMHEWTLEKRPTEAVTLN
jgi:thiosulfate/3-mercaptopyruvate sulfurtransferase